MEAGSPSGSQLELVFCPCLEGSRSRETSALLQAEKRRFLALSSTASRSPLCRDSGDFLWLLLASLPRHGAVDPVPLGCSRLGWGSEGCERCMKACS